MTTAWIASKGEYEFVPKPNKPFKCKGTTKYDEKFDRMLAEEVALVVPQDDLPAVQKAWQRYEVNKDIKGSHSFRREFNVRKKSYTVWVEQRSEKKE